MGSAQVLASWEEVQRQRAALGERLCSVTTELKGEMARLSAPLAHQWDSHSSVNFNTIS